MKNLMLWAGLTVAALTGCRHKEKVREIDNSASLKNLHEWVDKSNGSLDVHLTRSLPKGQIWSIDTDDNRHVATLDFTDKAYVEHCKSGKDFYQVILVLKSGPRKNSFENCKLSFAENNPHVAILTNNDDIVMQLNGLKEELAKPAPDYNLNINNMMGVLKVDPR